MSRSFIYLLTFLFSLHFTPALYINSSFLESFFNPEIVGTAFSIGSVFTIIMLLLMPKILRKFGAYKTFLFILFLNAVGLLVQTFSTVPSYIYTSFVITLVAVNISFLCMDLFLESVTKNKSTGSIRGYYLTFLNIAFIVGPYIASFLIDGGDFYKIYILGFFLTLLVFISGFIGLKKYKDTNYEDFSPKTIIKIIRSVDLRNIIFSSFLLNFFYSIVVIYVPLFLHTDMDLTLPQTSIVISISLIPFIIIQPIVGKIADKILGEKEMLITGFVIMAYGTYALAFANSTNIFYIGSILFLTRVGAALVEAMVEIYLYKKISVRNTNVISAFSMTRPLGYLVGPLIASAIFYFYGVSYQVLFTALTMFCVLGIWFGVRIKDTL